MEECKVSVIIPVYNVEDWIEECIESVVNQTYGFIEIIIIDDGSTDNSGKICDQYAGNTARKIKVIHTQNGGVSRARNIGMAEANGDYIMFLDGDDLINYHLIETAVNILNKNTDVCSIIYPYKNFVSNDEIIQKKPNYKEYIMDRKECLMEVFKGKNGKQRFRMLCCNKIYRKEYIQNLQFPVNRKLGEDSLFTYNFLRQMNKAIFLDGDPMYYYRVRVNSAINSKIAKANLQLFDTYNEIHIDIKEKFPCLKDAFMYGYIIRVFDFCLRLINENLVKEERYEMLVLLSKKIKPTYIELVRTKDITLVQKVLLVILKKNPKLFLWIYDRKTRR